MTMNREIELIREIYHTGNVEEAIRLTDEMLERQPDHPELLNIAGVCNLKIKNYVAAEDYLHRSVRVAPRSADVMNNLGVLYRETGRQEEAERWFRCAIAVVPNHEQALCNLGLLLRWKRHLKDAEDLLSGAVREVPESHRLLNMLGMILKDRGRLDHAQTIFRQALALQPHNTDYKLNLGNLLLYQGNWQSGLPLFEARCATESQGAYASPPPVSFPQWRGESIEGASLLVWPEQGLGDEIQLSRYIRRIKERGATRVTLVCSAAALRLFSALTEVDAIVAREAFDPSICAVHDFWTYIWSIPLNLRERPWSGSSGLPYLNVSAGAGLKWEHRIPKGRLRVGVVWRGNPANPNDYFRSLPALNVLERLWEIPGVVFVCLQKGVSETALRSEIGDRFILNLGNRVTDLADVAAIISRLDLVIGVDTAVVHLAAALGKPTWILLANVATDWRWGSDGVTSELYPGVVSLFRQGVDDVDWSGVVTRVADALSSSQKRKGA
ncbi:tetratricopeptide repeat protein [Paraburkholderia sp. J67]|uniref:tetratricopeptide repeat-containing glycosyltransferase family protein n=1 Tax=Paraburkholderia sp. J67 TaxID=2805435 RepID=UPI002ABD2E19|nr:tetratricopeptide repeat protein [Paraburkholderia sp. J67]